MPKRSRTEQTGEKPRFFAGFSGETNFAVTEKIRKRAPACGNGSGQKVLVIWRRAEWRCVFADSSRESQQVLRSYSRQEPKTVGHLAIGPTVALRWLP